MLANSINGMMEHDTDVGYQFLDSGNVLNIWNTNDDYFFEYPNMIQLSNHYNEYWSHNVVCLGYNTTSWNYLCTDTLPIWWEVTTDNETYVKVTGSKTLNIGAKSAMINWTYNLYTYDTQLNINLAITNVGTSDIDNELRFGWIINDIKIDNTYQNDKVTFWTNASQTEEYWLNESLNVVKTQDDLYYNFFRIYDNSSLGYLRLGWQYNQNYKVFVKSEAGQYNAPISLMLEYANGISAGQTRQTNFNWIDAIQCYAMWGDKYEPSGNYPSDTRFSDGNRSWGMTCHIDPASTACPISESPSACRVGVGGQHLFCTISVKYEGSAVWKKLLQTEDSVNCGVGDSVDYIGRFVDLTAEDMEGYGDLQHNNKTSYRCQVANDVYLDPFCSSEVIATDIKTDYWYNNNTPRALNVSIVANYTKEEIVSGDVYVTSTGTVFTKTFQSLVKFPIIDLYNVYNINNSLIYLRIITAINNPTNELIYWYINNQTWDHNLITLAEYQLLPKVNETTFETLSSVTVNTYTNFNVTDILRQESNSSNENLSIMFNNPIYNVTTYSSINDNLNLRIAKLFAPALVFQSGHNDEMKPYLYVNYWNYTTNYDDIVYNNQSLMCIYDYYDADGDGLNYTEFDWYRNGELMPQYANQTIIYADNTSIYEEWQCCAKVHDDVFTTGNEVCNISQVVTIEKVNDMSYKASIPLSLILGSIMFLFLGVRLHSENIVVKSLLIVLSASLLLIGLHTIILLFDYVETSLTYMILTYLIPFTLFSIVFYMVRKMLKGNIENE